MEGIQSIRRATIRELWTDADSVFPTDPSQVRWWEVWLRRRDGDELRRFTAFVAAQGLRTSEHYLGFGDRTVVLLHATADQLAHAFHSLDDIAELRQPHDVASFLTELPASEQAEWVDELRQRLRPAADGAPVVCILDTGVQDAHPLGDGFPPIEWLSDLRLDKYHHKVVRSGMGTVFRYGNRFGYQPLREHLVRRLESFGIGAKSNQILMTQGANSAMDLVIRYFVPPGATVLVDDPGYYLLFGKLKLADAKIIGVPRLPDGPDLEALEQLIIQQKPRLYFTQSAGHNPTGTDLAAWKAFRVLKLAQEHNLMIVENDALADFKPLSATRLCALDQLERTIYIGSFSKSFSASLRVGFIACSVDLASELADLKTLISTNSSEYCERTVDVILKEGHYDKHMVRLHNRVTEATELAYKALKSLGATIFGNSSQSLYLWASLPGISDTHILAKDLQKKGILIAPGRLFCVDSDPACEWSRFNTGALADPLVFRALQVALADCIQK